MTEGRSKVYYLTHYYYLIHHGIFFANKYGIQGGWGMLCSWLLKSKNSMGSP